LSAAHELDELLDGHRGDVVVGGDVLARAARLDRDRADAPVRAVDADRRGARAQVDAGGA
jgi:hypothetical protein